MERDKETQESKIEKTSLEFIKELFCPFCLKYPEYSINIESNKKVILEHSCLQDKIVKYKVSENEEIENIIKSKQCNFCKCRTYNICLKCELNICEECKKEHECDELLDEEGERKTLVVPIIDKQYYCDKHLLFLSKFCPICKVNLCHKCLIEHIHINSYKLFEDEKVLKNFEVSKYNGVNETLNELIEIAKKFHLIYMNGFQNKKMTLSIIFNFHLIRKINAYVNKYSTKNPKKNSTTIKNEIPKPKKKDHMDQYYGCYSFNKNYEALISAVYLGNIHYYHKLLEIQELYRNEDKLKENPLYFLKNEYLSSLNSSIKEIKDNIYRITDIIDFGDLKYYYFELMKESSKLKLIINMLELNIEELKKYVIDISYRNDYQLRRKVGNLITDKIIGEFYNDLGAIKINEYLLSLSIENIEDKIKKACQMRQNEKRVEYLSVLKKKYNKALELLNKTTTNKLEIIKKEDYDLNQIKTININMQFMPKNNEKNEVRKAVILNLFMYIRKELNYIMNDSIHNTTSKVNYIVKEEMDKIQNDINKNSDNIINNNNNIIINNGRKVDKNDKNNSEKDNNNNLNQCENKIDKSCKHIFHNINCIKQIIGNPSKIFEDKDNDYFLGQFNDNEIINLNVDDFKKKLNEIYKLYDINSEIQINNVFDLFFEGNKSEIISEQKKYISKKTLNKELNDLNGLLKCSNDKILLILKKTNKLFDRNIDMFERMQKETLNLINEMAEHFTVKDILNEFKIKLPLEPLVVINKLGSSKIYNIELLEKYVFILYLCQYITLEESISYLEGRKKKINELQIQELLKKDKIKNNLINEMRNQMEENAKNDLLSDVWNKINTATKIIEDNDELNNEILLYVKNGNKEKFKEDLISLIEPKIRGINMGLKDPQNIFLKPFMKQNCLDSEDI